MGRAGAGHDDAPGAVRPPHLVRRRRERATRATGTGRRGPRRHQRRPRPTTSRSDTAAPMGPTSSRSPSASGWRRNGSRSSTHRWSTAWRSWGSCPGSHISASYPRHFACPAGTRRGRGCPPGAWPSPGRQTAVYPAATPGGWHLIGRTDVRAMGHRARSAGDPASGRPCPLRAGRLTGCWRSSTPGCSPPSRTPAGPTPHRWACHARVPVDPLALAAANLLLGGDPTLPALELTGGSPALAALEDCVVAVTGADLGLRLDDGSWLRPGTSVLVRAGTTVRATTEPRAGFRTYLAVPGGVEVPRVLGSASTSLVGGFGGLDGRRLEAGDVLRAGDASRRTGAGHVWPGPGPSSGVTGESGPWPSRVTDGPHLGSLEGVAAAMLATEWVVGGASDRVGLRLVHAAGAADDGTRPVMRLVRAHLGCRRGAARTARPSCCSPTAPPWVATRSRSWSRAWTCRGWASCGPVTTSGSDTWSPATGARRPPGRGRGAGPGARRARRDAARYGERRPARAGPAGHGRCAARRAHVAPASP